MSVRIYLTVCGFHPACRRFCNQASPTCLCVGQFGLATVTLVAVCGDLSGRSSDRSRDEDDIVDLLLSLCHSLRKLRCWWLATLSTSINQDQPVSTSLYYESEIDQSDCLKYTKLRRRSQNSDDPQQTAAKQNWNLLHPSLSLSVYSDK